MSAKWTAMIAAAALAGGLASVAVAGDGALRERGRRGGMRHRARHVLQERRGARGELLRSLQFTEQQRHTMLEKARAAAPIVADAKAETRRIVAQAWAQVANDAKIDRKALRAGAKEQIKAVRAKAWTQLEPLANDVVATLTPEQRQKLQEAASKHGKTLDDAKLAKVVGRMISRPMAVPFLEARLGVTSPR